MQVAPDQDKTRLLSRLAYERTLEALFDRRVQVGAFISQQALSAIVGVPVGPLRDALRVLEAEGILTIHPRSGIQFVRPGLELTRATYQFRSILERAAVRQFAEEGETAIVDELHARHSALMAAIEKHGVGDTELADLDACERLLHGSVIGILRNILIESSYRRVSNYLSLIRLGRNMTPPVVLRTLREHLTIIDACRDRDADKAEAALQAHFNAGLRRNLGGL